MDNQSDLPNMHKRRRDLLPWWVKIFVWIFLVFGAIIPIVIILGIMGYSFKISLYGIESNRPLSIIGISLICLFIIKAVAAYSLWSEKNWAIDFSIIDSIIGAFVCSFVMFIYPLINSASGIIQNIRLELLLLIPFLLTLIKIKPEWLSIKSASN